MTTMKALPIVLVALLLAACHSEAPPPDQTVIDAQLKARDKAQAVEAQQQEHKDRLDEQLERDGG
jgi:outer membrane PBP1 activator LpoA protein